MKYEITLKRSPKDLFEFCRTFKDHISETELDNALLRKDDLYKFFIDEVWPLARFGKEYLDESYEIEPVQGNQGFDASVFQHGHHEFNIEVAYPHFGEQRAHQTRELVGGGIPKIRISSTSELEALLVKIESVCKSKSKKDYSDCILLFNVVTGALHKDQYIEFIPAMVKVENLIRQYKFRAKGVYIIYSPFEKVVKINS